MEAHFKLTAPTTVTATNRVQVKPSVPVRESIARKPIGPFVDKALTFPKSRSAAAVKRDMRRGMLSPPPSNPALPPVANKVTANKAASQSAQSANRQTASTATGVASRPTA